MVIEEDELDDDNKFMWCFGILGKSLKFELSELVERDVDVVVNVFKFWIGDVV